MTKLYATLPRLYTPHDLSENATVSLDATQVHYLKNVLRRGCGDGVRLFNGRDGEWLGHIEALSKKACAVMMVELLREQPPSSSRRALYFSPIKKNRLDIVIEKAVELGVTDLHPIITARTENRRMNSERVQAHIIEAAEQCERLSVPALHPVVTFDAMIHALDARLYACIERSQDSAVLSDVPRGEAAAYCIGAEGGFDAREVQLMRAHDMITPVCLGRNILRAETAAIVCLAHHVS